MPIPTPAAISAKMDAAIVALGAADYATAIRLATEAQGLMALIPDSVKDGHAGGELTFDRQGIERFVAEVRRIRNDAAADAGVGGIETVPIVYGHSNCYQRDDFDGCG